MIEIKKSSLQKVILLLFFANFTLVGKAQIPGVPKNLLSPNATSLGLYGEIPVSLFTGTPNINIPLCEIKYGEASVPISLNYHASGVRPDQHPGWVGIGWSLQAGGMISRVVKDLPDDYDNAKRAMIVAEDIKNSAVAGYYYAHLRFQQDEWNTTTATSVSRDNLAGYDSEPDEFSFQLPGFSGNFYLSQDGEWKVECDKPVKVFCSNSFIKVPFCSDTQFNNCRGLNGYNTNSFSGFTIVDEYGVQYVFGNKDASIEYSIDFFRQNDGEWFANTWMLTKIILTNGKAIDFDYQRESFVNQMVVSYSCGFAGLESGMDSGCDFHTDKEYPYQGMLISPVYLTKISTPIQSIDFIHSNTKELRYSESFYTGDTYGIYRGEYDKWKDGLFPYFYIDPECLFLSNQTFGYTPTSVKYENMLPFLSKWDPDTKTLGNYNTSFPACLSKIQWQQLDQILVTDKADNKYYKQFYFKYSNKDKQRLTLYSLTEVPGGDNKYAKKYSFDYYDMDMLPPYLSLMTDHWGYYNSQQASISDLSLRPDLWGYSDSQQASISFTSCMRDACGNARVASIGMLKKVTYPTGGETEFQYEPHEYYKHVDKERWNGVLYTGPKYAGGVRIKKIINYPNGENDTQNTSFKEYEYNQSGILGGQIEYTFNNYPQAVRDDYGYYGGIYKNHSSIQSVLPGCENTSGCHIGYSVVTEKNGDRGNTQYIFSNFDRNEVDNKQYLDDSFDFSLTNNATPYAPYNSRKMERGKLLQQKIYDSNQNLKKTTTISYTRVPVNDYVRTLRLVTEEVCDYYMFYDEVIASKIYTYSFLPKTTSETFYDNNGEPTLQTTTTNDYNDSRMLIKTMTNNSKGQYINTYYKYSGDCNGSQASNDENMTILNEMKNKNMIAYPVQTIKSIFRNEQEWVCGSDLKLYKHFNKTSTEPGIYKLWSEQSLKLDNPINGVESINILNSTNIGNVSFYSQFVENMRYNNYDKFGNPIFVTKNGTENSVYLWGYNYQYPVAEIKNATFGFSGTNDITSVISADQIELMAKDNIPQNEYWNKIESLRVSLPQSLVTKYAFSPLKGLSSHKQPNGTSIYYEYLPLTGILNGIYRFGQNSNKEYIKSFDYQFTNH